MIIKTRVLDKAAFFTTMGGRLQSIEGKYPHNEFVVRVPRLTAWYERAGGWVPYNQFCNQRKHLKRKARKISGLPEHFLGDKTRGLKLGDLAVITLIDKD